MASKECRHPTCSGETCRRVKKPKKIYTLKRTPVRRRSKSYQTRLGERKLTQQLDWEFFLEIWNERPHICFETGEPIYGEPLTLYFHHVLEKAIHKKYRYKKWNIVLVSHMTHSKCHNNIDFAPKVKAYRDKLIKKLGL